MNKRFRVMALFCMVFGCVFLWFYYGGGERGAAVPFGGATTQALSSDQTVGIQQKSDHLIAFAGDGIPISRALAAKMIAYVGLDDNGIDLLERVITFTDTQPDDWYDRYINAAVTQGLMNGGGNGAAFMPEEPLTLRQAQTLLDNLDKENKVKIQLTPENENNAISYALWTNLYYETLGHLGDEEAISDKYGIEKTAVVPLASPGSNSQLKEWYMITSTGPLRHRGLSMDDYIDKKIGILKKGGEVIAFLGIEDYAPTVESAYLVSKTETTVTVFAGGAERTYAYPAKELREGVVCDIKINGGTAETVRLYDEKRTGVVRKITETLVEIDGAGQLKLSETAKVYAVSDGVPNWKTLSALTTGTDNAEYVVHEGAVVAILITKTTLPETIRVSLHTTDYKGLLHPSVALTGDTSFTVRFGETTQLYQPGEIFTAAPEDAAVFGGGGGVTRIFIEPTEETGKIQILSIKRAWANGESPKYRGKIEIGLEEEGGLTIVNELPIEAYLYAVIPSEMPEGHGLEAAKVQAVTARSYAYNQYYLNKFHRYGANIDDSIQSQVYNNIPENATAIQAVNETAGQCLVYNGAVISANYFSTSAGMTANAGEVWADTATKRFPGETAPYVAAVKQYTEKDYGDLSAEKNAERFFTDGAVSGYDAAFPWFRWQTTMTAEELSASVNESLGARYTAGPRLIQTLNPETGVFLGTPVTSVGTIRDLSVVRRGQGGNIMQLKIVGTEATVLVSTEYNIRALLKPARVLPGGRDIAVTRQDGSTVENLALLPSAFFVMATTKAADGGLAAVTFLGGGNGHGVGMSQNGVKGMIDAGFRFDAILRHYYQGTEVRKMIQ